MYLARETCGASLGQTRLRGTSLNRLRGSDSDRMVWRSKAASVSVRVTGFCLIQRCRVQNQFAFKTTAQTTAMARTPHRLAVLFCFSILFLFAVFVQALFRRIHMTQDRKFHAMMVGHRGQARFPGVRACSYRLSDYAKKKGARSSEENQAPN